MPNVVIKYDPDAYVDTYPVHESNLTREDVRQLVLDLKTFLAGLTFPDQKPLRVLQEALASPTATINVIKGIHQRGTDPHITLKVDEYVYHQELTEAEIPGVNYSDGTPVTLFEWKTCRVSVFDTEEKGKPYMSHPVGVVADRKTGRSRSNSITQGQIMAHVEGVNRGITMRAEQAAREKMRADEELRQKNDRAALGLAASGFPILSDGAKKPAPPVAKAPVAKGPVAKARVKPKWSKLT